MKWTQMERLRMVLASSVVLIALALGCSSSEMPQPSATASNSTPGPVASADSRGLIVYADTLNSALFAEDLSHSQKWRFPFDPVTGYISALDCSQSGQNFGFVKVSSTGGGFSLAVSMNGEQKELPLPAGISGVAWSPDGTRIAATDYAIGSNTYRVTLIDPAGGQTEELVSGPGTVGAPRWSPDGTQIVFDALAPDGSSSQLFVYTLGHEAPVPLNTAAMNVYSPDWSPSDGTVAFAALTEAGFRQVYKVAADGSGEAQVTTSQTDKGFPRWAPDGSLMAYVGTVIVPQVSREPLARHNLGIFTANADGSGEAAFTDLALDARLMAWCRPGAWLNQGWEKQ